MALCMYPPLCMPGARCRAALSAASCTSVESNQQINRDMHHCHCWDSVHRSCCGSNCSVHEHTRVQQQCPSLRRACRLSLSSFNPVKCCQLPHGCVYAHFCPIIFIPARAKTLIPVILVHALL